MEQTLTISAMFLAMAEREPLGSSSDLIDELFIVRMIHNMACVGFSANVCSLVIPSTLCYVVP